MGALRYFASTTLFLLMGFTSSAQEMTTYLSPFGVAETVSKFKEVIEKHDLILFDVINHHDAALKVGQEIRPTVVVIFENPELGTQWTICEQTVAIDLPFRVLIWEEETGDTFLSYTNPRLIAKRHQVKECPDIADQINRILVRVINETIRER